ncbi:MAG: 3D domain-containing protein [Bacillota bacterium]|jgi:uncharacterized protein YabE (DUF348 family)/3D (Asp-Asp-Asp) domain-containing protein
MENREKASLSPTPSRWRNVLKNKKFIALIASVCCCFVFVAFLTMEKSVIIEIDGQAQEVFTKENRVADILKENNVILYEGDIITPQVTEKVDNNSTISISRAFEIKISADGNEQIVRSTQITVEDALSLAGISLGKFDEVSLPLDTVITQAEEVNVSRIDVQYREREVAIKASVETKRDDSLAQGKSKVVQEGADGLKKETIAIYLKDGQETFREVTKAEVIKEPKTKIVAKGTMQLASRSSDSSSQKEVKKASPQKKTQDKKTQNKKTQEKKGTFDGKKSITVKAYAYSGGGKTAMGTNARVGAIAVDPKVIPLGTKLYIEGYGYATAEDTGGNIKGKTIDVYFNSKAECRSWGVKYIKVYFL